MIKKCGVHSYIYWYFWSNNLVYIFILLLVINYFYMSPLCFHFSCHNSEYKLLFAKSSNLNRNVFLLLDEIERLVETHVNILKVLDF